MSVCRVTEDQCWSGPACDVCLQSVRDLTVVSHANEPGVFIKSVPPTDGKSTQVSRHTDVFSLSWLLPVMAKSHYSMATSRYGCFPLWLLPVMATSHHSCFPLWLLPVMATSHHSCFLLWLLPVMAASCYGYFPLWLLPIIAASCYGYFPLWLLPVMATSCYGYYIIVL